METVTLTIDGRPVTVAKGKTVLQAAIEAGISVPYYCYHPGLGIENQILNPPQRLSECIHHLLMHQLRHAHPRRRGILKPPNVT